jgi:hypothetical protein
LLWADAAEHTAPNGLRLITMAKLADDWRRRPEWWLLKCAKMVAPIRPTATKRKQSQAQCCITLAADGAREMGAFLFDLEQI